MQVFKMFEVPFLVHDSWSELYVGTRYLVYELLCGDRPPCGDAPLCGLALVGANMLMEITLYKILKPYLEQKLNKKDLERVTYFCMLTKHWSDSGKSELSLEEEPWCSTECLRQKRNDIVHKGLASLITVEMARSGLFSAVKGTQALYEHAKIDFPYEVFLQNYPLHNKPWFSNY